MNHNILSQIIKKFSRQGYHLVIKTGHPETNEIINIHNMVYTDRDEAYKKIEDRIYSEATRDKIFNYGVLAHGNTKIEDYLKGRPTAPIQGFRLRGNIIDEEGLWKHMKELFRQELEKKKPDTHFKMQLSVILNLHSRYAYDIDPNNRNDIWLEYEEVDII